MAAVAHPGRGVGDGVEHLLDRRAHACAAECACGGWLLGPRLPGQGEEVVALGLVELQGVGEGVEDALGGAGEAAALHAHVVVDRDTGEHGDLFAAQPLDPAVAAVRGQTRSARG